MEKYLEIVEQLKEQEKVEKLPEMIRIRVTDETDARAKMIGLKNKVKNPKCFLHLHYHFEDSNLNKPCEIIELIDEKSRAEDE